MPLLEALNKAFPSLPASADGADRVAYARDLWPRHHLEVRAGRVAEHKPGAIVWPRLTEEVQSLVKWAKDARVPLVPFGAGSGVCAGVLPREDVVVVDVKRMSRWRALHEGAPALEVEAGEMGVPLEEKLNRRGFTLGHFPSSILCSSVGGWVAARSAGQCSGYYGKIEDMVAAVECVTGDGEVVTLNRRTTGPNLVPLVVGSEGTLGIITSATLRLHAAPTARAFAAWTFPTTEDGWEGMRALFQAGLRPAVSRLYDPFDAMLARMGGVSPAKSKHDADKAAGQAEKAPGLGVRALRGILSRPELLNDLVHSTAGGRALGGAMLVVIFEGVGERPGKDLEAARALLEGLGGKWVGEGPAQRWLKHRYSVSYRQAPMFAAGAFVDTMEVAATWSRLGALYDGVRRALGEHVFVMAHFSHAYPDGCCIYFSFAGSAAKDARNKKSASDWDEACEAQYDRAWKAAQKAAIDAGGTLAHHHGVGRSKAPRLGAELGVGVDVVRGLMRTFDPAGIMNPGNLLPAPSSVAVPSVAASTPQEVAASKSAPIDIDRVSLLVSVDGEMALADLEAALRAESLTLDLAADAPLASSVRAWLDAGAVGARDAWLDPVDQIVAGLDATLRDGRVLSIRPAPRRAVGPDLTALVVGCGGRFATLTRAHLRVHKVGVIRPTAPFEWPREPAPNDGETRLLTVLAAALAPREVEPPLREGER